MVESQARSQTEPATEMTEKWDPAQSPQREKGNPHGTAEMLS